MYRDVFALACSFSERWYSRQEDRELLVANGANQTFDDAKCVRMSLTLSASSGAERPCLVSQFRRQLPEASLLDRELLLLQSQKHGPSYHLIDKPKRSFLSGFVVVGDRH